LILAVETSSRVGSVAIAIGPLIKAEVTFSGQMRHSAELFPAICTLLDRIGRKPQDIEQVYISIGPGSFTGLRIAVTLAKSMHLANSAKIISVDTLDVIASNVINLNSMSDEHQASRIELIAPILDAKRGQFYIAVYQKQKGFCHEDARSQSKELSIKYKKDVVSFGLNGKNSCLSALVADSGRWNKIVPDSLMTADEFLEKFACKEKPVWLLGDGLVYHKDRFKAEGVCFFDEEFWSPRASNVHHLGWQLALANQFENALLLTPNYLLRPDIKIKKQ